MKRPSWHQFHNGSAMRLRSRFVAVVLGLFVTVTAGAQDIAEAQDVQRSVVKILAIQRAPNLLEPWQRQPPLRIAGSGVVIEGHRILTNAHLVMYASQIDVQLFQSRETFTATVVALSPGMDLAILKLDEKDETAFFKLLGICFLRVALEGAVEGIGDGEKGG